MESLISNFVQFSSGIAKCLLGTWLYLHSILRLPKISPFFTILSLNVEFSRLRKFLPN